MIARKRSMPLKPGRVSGCIKHRFRRDKRLQSGTNSGGRTWEKAGSSREQRCSKKNSENATSESAWEQRQDSKSKRSIWCHKILDSEKMCAGHR